MHISHRRIIREAGTAFAVLAIYVLTLLLPLHQAAGLQRDLNAIGYSTLDSWSICAPLVTDHNGDPRHETAVNCPAVGVAKHQLAIVLPPVPVLAAPATTVPVVYTGLVDRAGPLLPDHFGQSRAPPAAV